MSVESKIKYLPIAEIDQNGIVSTKKNLNSTPHKKTELEITLSFGL